MRLRFQHGDAEGTYRTLKKIEYILTYIWLISRQIIAAINNTIHMLFPLAPSEQAGWTPLVGASPAPYTMIMTLGSR